MKHLFVTGICSLALCLGMGACKEEAKLEGTWLEPVPGMEQMTQGFTLEEGGKASSVNMATLQYDKWERNGDNILLQGTSIGNGISFQFTDTLNIEQLTTDSLILKRKGFTVRYYREK